MVDYPGKRVSVIIVTCGAGSYLSDCLRSIHSQTFKPFQTLVIDNSASTSLRQKLLKEFPEVNVTDLKNNFSYAVSLNAGINLTQGEFILCLNDDVVLHKEFISEALSGFFDKSIGIVSGKILRYGGKIIDSTGLLLSVFRTPKERGYGKEDKGQFAQEGFVFGVSGCVAFYRREMLEKISDRYGYFDSRFLMFYEDLDLSWRANRKGWKAYYIPGAIAYHARGGSFRPQKGMNKGFARRYLNDMLLASLLRNRYLTILKNESLTSFLIHFLPVILYEFVSLTHLLLLRPKAVKFLFVGKLHS